MALQRLRAPQQDRVLIRIATATEPEPQCSGSVFFVLGRGRAAVGGTGRDTDRNASGKRAVTRAGGAGGFEAQIGPDAIFTTVPFCFRDLLLPLLRNIGLILR